MEFLASLAIKALIGTSVCGAVTVGSVYGYDKTLLGFSKDVKPEKNTSDSTGSSTSNVKPESEKPSDPKTEDGTASNTVKTTQTTLGSGGGSDTQTVDAVPAEKGVNTLTPEISTDNQGASGQAANVAKSTDKENKNQNEQEISVGVQTLQVDATNPKTTTVSTPQ